MSRRILGFIFLLLFVFPFNMSFAVPDIPVFHVKASERKVLAVKLQKTLSVEELIQSSGYLINDMDIAVFLAAFSELNPDIKSLSAIKKGSMVRLPLGYLGKPAVSVQTFRQKAELLAVKRKIIRKKKPVGLAAEEPLHIDRTLFLRNIRTLFSSLGQDVSIETEGFRYFPLSEKSDFSFDSGLFPIVDLHDNRILVLDYTGSFPEEVKNLLEIYWPEYRVIGQQDRYDLRSLAGLLLKESGYQVHESGRMISGGASQVEYYSDYIVQGKIGSSMEGDISLVSIINQSEYKTPAQLVSWFMGRDVRIIELADHDNAYINSHPGDIMESTGLHGRAFIENLIDTAGYPFAGNKKISLSSRKEIQYNLNADIVIDLGYGKKIIQLSEFTDQEAAYVRRHGLDMTYIEPWESRRDSIKKILSLLSVAYTFSPQKNASDLSPKHTRYRLLLPGFVVQTRKGRLFITDTEFRSEFLKGLIDERISVLKF